MPNHQLIVLLCVLLGGVSQSLAESSVGEPAGPISLIDADGHAFIVKNEKQRNGTVFIFLSSRSDAVIKSIADINRLYRKHRRQGILYIGVCSNGVESAQELRNFAQNQGLIFSIYHDREGQLARRWDVSFVPAAVFVDQEGKIAHRGGLETEELQLALDAAITNRIKPSDLARSIKPTPIADVPPERPQSNAFGSLAFSSELIFEKISGAPAHHCSTIAQTPQGDLLCLWYGGSYESADDQTLFLARRPKGSRIWETPQPLIRDAERPPGNGVIFVDEQRRIWIIWCRMESPRPRPRGSGWNNCRLMSRTSLDDGKTWSADSEFLGDELRAVPRNPPLRLANGVRILAVEAHLKGKEGSTFLIGADGGTRWSLGGFVTGGSQPAVVERRDGSIYALMREAPRLTQSISNDQGHTWSEATPSKVRNPDAGISMTRLSNGHLILVFNDSETMRTPLSVARSLDEGLTWETPMNLESNLGEYSYPCVIQTADGHIHVSYTFRRYSIKHVELNEDWIVHTERPN